MSYILDALRRADRERRRNAGDPTVDVVALGPVQSPATRRLTILLLLVGVAILVLLAINLAFNWSGTDRAPTTTATRAPAASPTPLTSDTQVNQAVLAPAASPGEEALDSQPSAQIPTLVPAGDASTVATVAAGSILASGTQLDNLAELTPTPPRPAVHAAAVAPPANSAKAVEPATKPAPPSGNRAGTAVPDTGTQPSAGQSELAGTSLKATSAPASIAPTSDLKLMPDAFRASFPQISVEVHVYDSDPGKRWAMIDGARYREGDTLPNGLKLEHIVPQGIVFGWHGKQVLYPT